MNEPNFSNVDEFDIRGIAYKDKPLITTVLSIQQNIVKNNDKQ